MKISIVSTLYNSAPNLEAFCNIVSETVKELTDDYEIILVNDGSPDNALQVALNLHANDPHIAIIDLSRNFGEHKARMTGLRYATGDYIFLIQSDLDVSPRYLIDFWKMLTSSEDTEMVFGIQEKRRGNWLERIQGNLFYWLFNVFSDIKISPNDVACRLMTRRFVDALLMHEERTVFFAGLCALTGFTQKSHIVTKSRTQKTSYNLRRSMRMTVEAITSFSYFPLMLVFYLGSLISVIAILYISVILTREIFFGIPISGWTSIIISLWFFGGLITASIGLIGIYLSRIFLEVKHRPYTIIRQTYGIAPGKR